MDPKKRLVVGLALTLMAFSIPAFAQCSSGNCGSMMMTRRFQPMQQRMVSSEWAQQQRTTQRAMPIVQSAPPVREQQSDLRQMIATDQQFDGRITFLDEVRRPVATNYDFFAIPVSFTARTLPDVMLIDHELSPLQHPQQAPVQAPFQKQVQAPAQKSWDSGMAMEHSYMEARARPVRRAAGGILGRLFGGRRGGSCASGSCN